VKFSVVSLHGDFGAQGMEGCLCYVVAVGWVIERAATNSHLGAFPAFIKAAYFLVMIL
jgi:hypothetical protein